MKLAAMHVMIFLMPCFSASTQFALPGNIEPNENETVLAALMTKKLLEDSKSIVTKCVNCVGKCLNCATTKIKDLVWKKTEETVEKKFTEAIEAYAVRKEIFNKGFSITETTMNQKTYLIIALQHDSQLGDLEIEKNEHLGIFLYKEMNNFFKDGILENSLQKIIVKMLYRQWTNMTDSKRSTAQLLITGHSIGGGLAQILGTYLKSQTENLVSHCKLEHDEPMFAEMLKKTKVYTFSTPFVFLKKQTEDLPRDWIVLQKEFYNFISTTNTLKVTSKTFLRKVWDDFFRWINQYGVGFGALSVLVDSYDGLFTVTSIAAASIFGLIIGLGLKCVRTIIYAVVIGLEHLFRAVINFFSKDHPEAILDANPDYMLVEFSVEKKPKLKQFLSIDDHIKYFFSNTNFLNQKALPAPDKKETADETFIKKETVALVQKEVKTLVAVDGNVKKTNDKVEPSPITNQPSKVVQLGVIVVFILSVIHL